MDEVQNNEPQAASGGQDELSAVREKLARAEKERDEYLNGWKRAKADFLNYQKEEMARMDDTVKYGNEEILHELIAVMDSFDLACAFEKEKEGAPEARGMMMIRSQMETLLKNHGMEPIHANAGSAFDPSLHEAIGEAESGAPPGTIVEEVSRGWKLYNKVVRPARVKISKGHVEK